MNCPECGMRMVVVMDAERRHWWVCPRCKIQLPKESGFQEVKHGNIH